MFNRLLQFGRIHKISASILTLVILGGGFYSFRALTGTADTTRYALAVIERGTIITAVSGSGQVSTANQLDIKPKVSGDVTYLNAQAGQAVVAGTWLAQLDSRDAQKAVRDAQISLENAQITLQKLKFSQQTSTPKLQDAITTAQNNLAQAHQNGYNEVANSFLDLPNVLSGIRGILYDATVGSSGQTNTGAYQNLVNQDESMKILQMVNQAVNDYLASQIQYASNLDSYKNTARTAPAAEVLALISQTLETAKQLSQSVKDEQNILDAVTASLKQASRNIPVAITQYQADIASYISKLNGHITGLTNYQNSITGNQQTLVANQRELANSQQSDPLDVSSQENAVEQRQAALQDAKDALANYSIRAPFAGVLAKVNVQRGDSIGPSTAVATLITRQALAEVSLNEVDVAKINVGQKATLTFDAIPDLTITGQVLSVDALGTVSQGVVTYNVKIGFDTQDQRVKPGMSVSAAIITNSKLNVLLVPNSAVKSSGGSNYVELPAVADVALASQQMATVANAASGVVLPAVLRQQSVELGLASDTVSEVTSGLQAGDWVITRTIATSKTTVPAAGNNLFQTGNNRTGSGATRLPAR